MSHLWPPATVPVWRINYYSSASAHARKSEERKKQLSFRTFAQMLGERFKTGINDKVPVAWFIPIKPSGDVRKPALAPLEGPTAMVVQIHG